LGAVPPVRIHRLLSRSEGEGLAGTGSPRGNAQVDFVVRKGSSIIPIEVKPGATGTMQNLRLSMAAFFWIEAIPLSHDIRAAGFLPAPALPHKKSNPKRNMPQNKILTQINASDEGIGGQHGVTSEHEKSIDRTACFPISKGRQKRQNQNVG
jgi:hypothetical protein